MREIVFVRHAAPAITSSTPSTWSLSTEGRSAAQALGHTLIGDHRLVVASTETKAVETAEHLGIGPVRTDPRLGEVAKPWYVDPLEHDRAAVDYLAGADIAEWEPRSLAVDRFSDAVENLSADESVVVTHGTILTLWLCARDPAIEPTRLWRELAMPAAIPVRVDAAS